MPGLVDAQCDQNLSLFIINRLCQNTDIWIIQKSREIMNEASQSNINLSVQDNGLRRDCIFLHGLFHNVLRDGLIFNQIVYIMLVNIKLNFFQNFFERKIQ